MALATCDKHGNYVVGCDDCKIKRTLYTRNLRRSKGVVPMGSPEYSRKMSENRKKSKGFTGKKHSLGSKLKISLSNRTGKLIICDNCGKEKYKKASEIRSERAFCSVKCSRRYYSGSRNNHWKGGITPLKKKLRMSKAWSEWREIIFKRDNHTCQECRQHGGYLEPHHIIPIKQDMNKIFDINNGITLCRPCHIDTMGKEEKFVEKYFSLLNSLVTAYG